MKLSLPSPKGVVISFEIELFIGVGGEGGFFRVIGGDINCSPLELFVLSCIDGGEMRDDSLSSTTAIETNPLEPLYSLCPCLCCCL